MPIKGEIGTLCTCGHVPAVHHQRRGTCLADFCMCQVFVDKATVPSVPELTDGVKEKRNDTGSGS